MKSKLDLPSIGFEIVNALLVLSIIGSAIYIYPALPEVVPSHYNVQGVVDKTGGKAIIIYLSIIPVVINILISFVVRFPQAFNYPVKVTEENRPELEKISISLLKTTKFIVAALFLYLIWCTANIAWGKMQTMPLIPFFTILGVLFLNVLIAVIKMNYAK